METEEIDMQERNVLPLRHTDVLEALAAASTFEEVIWQGKEIEPDENFKRFHSNVWRNVIVYSNSSTLAHSRTSLEKQSTFAYLSFPKDECRRRYIK